MPESDDSIATHPQDDSIATHYNLNYDLPIYDPFTHGRYTFYRATDVNNSPMFRPLRLDSKYPRAWEFTKRNAETSFYQVPVCRSQPTCASMGKFKFTT